jgi:hypothetical protein
MVFAALLCNVYQQWMFFCSQAHIPAGWWLPKLLISHQPSTLLAHNWFGVAMQWLMTVGAPPPPMPPPSVTVSRQPHTLAGLSACILSPDSELTPAISLTEVEVKLRQTVSWPACLGVRHPSGTRSQLFFLLGIFCRQLWVCYFVAASLTRGRIYNLLLLLVLASTILRDSRPYFIVPILETPPTWRSRSPYLYPPGTRWPRYTPGTGFPFRRLLWLARLR